MSEDDFYYWLGFIFLFGKNLKRFLLLIKKKELFLNGKKPSVKAYLKLVKLGEKYAAKQRIQRER